MLFGDSCPLSFAVSVQQPAGQRQPHSILRHGGGVHRRDQRRRGRQRRNRAGKAEVAVPVYSPAGGIRPPVSVWMFSLWFLWVFVLIVCFDCFFDVSLDVSLGVSFGLFLLICFFDDG